MRILLAASEAVPYFKSGGLADVARALPDALARRGHDVRIIHPYYGFTASKLPALALDRMLDLPWPGGIARVPFLLHQPERGVPAVLVEHNRLFRIPEPYASGIDPLGVGERFAFFARAALHYARDWGADILHLNDWQTGLVPIYQMIDEVPMATVFSIHNLAYQGNFPVQILDRTGISRHFFRTENGLEFHRSASFMKGGLALADRLTTVSPTYAREIQTPEMGAGFEGLLRFRSRALHGILNGLDVESWNPATDRAIASNYNADDMAGKEACRAALLRELRLSGDGPLVVAVSRLAHQKGIDVLLHAMPTLLNAGASIAMLGDGDTGLEHSFARAMAAFPGRVAALFRFDDALSRRFYAGADFFVMPSRYEPCGLGQMIAQRYGTIPVVRHTGGLVDTVQDGVTGFAFAEAKPESLYAACRRAFAFRHTDAWQPMRERCMRIDHSWEQSAQKYEQVYHAAIGPNSA